MEQVKQLEKNRRDLLNEYLSSSRNKSIVVSAVTILFFILFMIIGVIPAFRSLLAQNKENNLIKETTERAQQKINTMRGMVEEQEENPEVFEALEYVIPEDVSQQDVLDTLYELAGDNVIVIGIAFPEFIPDQPSDLPSVSGQIINVEVSMRVEGRKDVLVEYVNRLEASRKVFNLRTVQLSRKSDTQISEVGFEREYDMSLAFDYYYWDPMLDN
jgi:hypothetical protein